MANGASGATGASARQSLLMELNFVIASVIRQRQSITESIVRWVEGDNRRCFF